MPAHRLVRKVQNHTADVHTADVHTADVHTAEVHTQLMCTMCTKESFLVPLEMSQKLPSCVTGAAKYALDSCKGLVLQ